MSHWVNRPRLVNAISGKVLLNLSNSLWHADEITWSEDGESVVLELRRYPGDVPGVSLDVNLTGKTARLLIGETKDIINTDEVLNRLEMYYQTQHRF